MGLFLRESWTLLPFLCLIWVIHRVSHLGFPILGWVCSPCLDRTHPYVEMWDQSLIVQTCFIYWSSYISFHLCTLCDFFLYVQVDWMWGFIWWFYNGLMGLRTIGLSNGWISTIIFAKYFYPFIITYHRMIKSMLTLGFSTPTTGTINCPLIIEMVLPELSTAHLGLSLWLDLMQLGQAPFELPKKEW